MRIRAHLLALGVVGCALGACANDSQSGTALGPLDKAYAAFRDGLKECTAKTGYDPDESKSLGPYDLGAGELPWRECAYSALLSFIVPNTSLPGLYTGLIEKDRQLTLGIQEKRVTRDERAAQISSQRDQIISQEQSSQRMSSAMTDLEERRRQDMIVRSTHVLVPRPRR
jgi:hypothetical protein